METIEYYQDKIALIDNGIKNLDLTPENIESLKRLKIYALEKIQRIRLAQLLAMEKEYLRELIQSN